MVSPKHSHGAETARKTEKGSLSMTKGNDIDELRNAARKLVGAIDDMHNRGETFTARVSMATYALRKLLTPTWPKDDANGEL